MFKSFKSLELFRHQISSRVDKSLREYADQSKASAEQISSTIFSSFISLLVSYLCEKFITSNEIKKALIIFAVFMVVYIIAYFIYKHILYLAEKISYNLKHHGTTITDREAKEYIDNFDHIACDNNLVGKEFIKIYSREKDIDLKSYDFYELYYYINVSAEIMLSVLNNSEQCLNTLSTTTKIDLHRIYNQLNMSKSATKFLLDHIKDKDIALDYNLMLVIIFQIDKLSEKLNLIEEKCDTYKEQNFSDKQVKELADKYRSFFQSP